MLEYWVKSGMLFTMERMFVKFTIKDNKGTLLVRMLTINSFVKYLLAVVSYIALNSSCIVKLTFIIQLTSAIVTSSSVDVTN